MSGPESSFASLADLRAEIDRIDDAMHDAVMRRAELVSQIQASKPPGLPAIRPAREAQIIRRLLARHSGRFPQAALVRMWAEMIAAFTHLQGGLRIAAAPGLERLVQAQYGALAEVSWEKNPVKLVLAAMDGSTLLSVLPWPGSWWRTLAGMPERPSVVGCLLGDDTQALVIARVPLEPSGQDYSWLVTPIDHALPGAVELAREGGMKLMQIDRFVTGDDPTLAGCVLLGAFPVPHTLNGQK